MQQVPEITADGSHTLYVPELDEHYHSVNGAIQESMHVYIQAGLNHYTKKEITVLEFGFGTGLNALLTFLEAQKRNLTIRYITLEKYPLLQETVKQLNYAEQMGVTDIFASLHAASWNESYVISPFFMIKKIAVDFADYTFPDHYDVVYYDAFGPDKQPEVWKQEIFDKLFEKMNPEGVLTTYCAKGEVRRMLQRAGFEVERIPGPPGKREMLRGKVKAKA